MRIPVSAGTAVLVCGAAILFDAFPVQGRARKPRDAQQTEIQRLEERIAQLEQTVAQLKSQIEAVAPPPATPQTPSPAPAPLAQNVPPAPAKPHFEMPPELLPEVGKIGAEVGVILAGSTSPFRLGSGGFAGGYIDLPLFDRPRWLHGKVSYEIAVGLTQSKTTFSTTSNVAQVANLTLLNTLNPSGGLTNVQQAVSGTGSAPFPVTASTETKLRLLQVIPFALKYTPTFLDRYRLRPYAVVGFGTYVTIHVQNPARGNPPNYGVRPNANLPPEVLSALNTLFSGQAPFGGPLVAGQISQSAELEARGLPGGHGNLNFGYQAGGGLAVRITRGMSLGLDARYNRIAGTNGSFVTYGSRIGVHF
jgi:opacity protein-like surface antigen